MKNSIQFGVRLVVSVFLSLTCAACSSPESYLAHGNTAYFRGDTVEAAQQYQRALKFERTANAAALNLGRLYFEAGDLEKAEPLLRRGSAERPDFALARYQLAVIDRLRGESESASAEIRKAILLDPSWGRIWLEEVPGDRGARLSYARALHRLGRTKQAAGEYREVMAQGETDPFAVQAARALERIQPIMVTEETEEGRP